MMLMMVDIPGDMCPNVTKKIKTVSMSVLRIRDADHTWTELDAKSQSVRLKVGFAGTAPGLGQERSNLANYEANGWETVRQKHKAMPTAAVINANIKHQFTIV